MSVDSISVQIEGIPADAAGVAVSVDDDVVTLTLNRPEVRNAQTPGMWRRLQEIAVFVAETNPLAVVLTGEGQSFSAGLDKRMFTPEGVPGEGSLFALAGQPAEEIAAEIADFQQAFSWLSSSPALTIAAVQGHAIGAGFQLALNCDIIVCAQDAQFNMREADYGLVPDVTGTSPLVRAVGYRRALEMCLTTRFVTAQEAVSMGLAVAAVPNEELDDRVQTYVSAARSRVPGLVADLKQLLQHAQSASPEAQYERERLTQVRRLEALKALAGG